VHHDLEDLVAWHYDDIGNFSVKSAYRVQRDHEKRSSRKGVASSSGVGLAINLEWKRL
jgi:predicted porin